MNTTLEPCSPITKPSCAEKHQDAGKWRVEIIATVEEVTIEPQYRYIEDYDRMAVRRSPLGYAICYARVRDIASSRVIEGVPFRPVGEINLGDRVRITVESFT